MPYISYGMSSGEGTRRGRKRVLADDRAVRKKAVSSRSLEWRTHVGHVPCTVYRLAFCSLKCAGSREEPQGPVGRDETITKRRKSKLMRCLHKCVASTHPARPPTLRAAAVRPLPTFASCASAAS